MNRRKRRTKSIEVEGSNLEENDVQSVDFFLFRSGYLDLTRPVPADFGGVRPQQ